MPRGNRQQLEQRRLAAITLLKQGHHPAEVARRLKTTRRSVERWAKAYRHGRENALRSKTAPGRPPKLSARNQRTLIHCLLRGPSACGFPAGGWTYPRIVQLIQSRFAVDYHAAAIPRLLVSLGVVLKRRPGNGRVAVLAAAAPKKTSH